MRTRFSSLVNVKKNIMQKSQMLVLSANQSLQNAQNALQDAYRELELIVTPKSGKIGDLLAFRALLDAQRNLIKRNEEWFAFAQKELARANETLKLHMIEYEKFKYLELEEIKAALQQQKKSEAKNLDEIAIIGFSQHDRVGSA